ncbi:hypothetical protein FACS18949_18210 [Clostridia bacterium]|nr:hypothetical protein FACS18949_18210 [Clostridia bacterium]
MTETHFSEYVDFRAKNKANIASYWICVAGTVALETFGLIMYLTGVYSTEFARSFFVVHYFIIPIASYVLIGIAGTVICLALNRRRPVFTAYCQMLCLVLMISVVVTAHLLDTIFSAFAVATVLSLMYNNRKLTFTTTLFGIAAYIFIALVIIPDSGRIPPHNMIDMTANIIILGLTWFLSMRFVDSCDRLTEKIVSAELEKSELRHRLERDALTDLYNHAAFYSHLDEMIMRYRQDGADFSIVVYDIDNFKKVNDSYGHAFGDEVLLGISAALEKYGDVLAHRYGGEEFALIIKDGMTRAAAIADELRGDCAALTFYADGTAREAANALHFTISGGVAQWRDSYGGRREFFAAADEALYMAKQNGKNQICRAN